MARFRIETVTDPVSGLVSIELYYPDDAAVPIAATPPIYPSQQAAEDDAINIIKAALPDQPVKPVS